MSPDTPYSDESGYGGESSGLPFSDIQLKETARQLSRSQRYRSVPERIEPIRPRLQQIRQTLTEAYKVLSEAFRNEQEVSPAAEWVIDNFYIIQEQIVQVQSDFPVEFQRSIPVLVDGEFSGLPRVYELLQHLVLHTDNMVEAEMLVDFIQSFQEEETLTLGEVWSIPIMARLVLLEQLRNRVAQIVSRKEIQTGLRNMADRLLESDEAGRDPVEQINLLTEWFLAGGKSSGVRELALLYQLLQRQDLMSEEVRRWFRGRFQRLDVTLEEALNLEAQRHSRLQVSIQNAVVSLRQISETDWKEVVEICSRTEQILRLDPAGIYAEMDFQTRDRYRQVIERLSRRSGQSETEVAETVLLMAESPGTTRQGAPETGLQSLLEDRSPVRKHVGYYLIDEGYDELIRRIGYRPPIRERFNRLFERSVTGYFTLITVHTIVLLTVLWYITGATRYPDGLGVALLVIAFFPALDLSITAINRLFAIILPPRILPKMRFRRRIPDAARTIVVVPTLLSSEEDVKNQVEKLEVRSLANPEQGLQFALLGDFPDAPAREMDGDRPILETADRLIAELNGRAASRYGKRFFLLHRNRIWNESEGVWMGWERKRGKLEELNRLLAEPDVVSGYSHITDGFLDSIRMKPVRFVITLDADTKLPPESARDLIRTAAHPLNRAHWNQESGKVIQGYGIIQPRISIPPESARRTWFSRIFSGNVGIDAYSTVVSDIYQDLMGEAVFTGKGIYDPEAFHKVLHNRFPPNRILSHDLIESNYLRAGLATSLELFDDFPSNYIGFSRRNHRWTRGDWQIAGWLLPRIPGASGREPNPLNGLSRWKILDNLRRSLNPFFLMLFFLSGWFWLPGSAWIWTLAAFGILAFPIYVTLSTDLMNRPARVRWKLYLGKVRSNLAIHSVQAISVLALLPHQALIHLDAIFRVAWRLIVSGRHLLEWTTASEAERQAPDSFSRHLQSMIISPLIGLLLPLLALWTASAPFGLVLPFAMLWTVAPWAAWYFSRPIHSVAKPFTLQEQQKLRCYARRTWLYFERYMTEEYFWLPPDNVQENPPLRPVARTSPTNIGLSLLSIHTAYCMGYITFSDFIGRVERTMNSLERLERYRGHLFNWYDLRTGETLPPRYVSTVDSGNLAAGLIVTAQALRQEYRQGGEMKVLDGLKDTLFTLREVFSDLQGEAGQQRLFHLICEVTNRVLEPLTIFSGESPLQAGRLLKQCRPELERLAGLDLMALRQVKDSEWVESLQILLSSPLRQVDSFLEVVAWINAAGEEAGMNGISPERLATALESVRSANPEERPANVEEPLSWARRVEDLARRCESLADQIDFTFLYDQKRALFHIGFDSGTSRLDKSTYDLLASEARIASYFAISRGQVLPEHWFRLSRRLTSLRRNEILLSWGGTMFEYLMPLLFMRSYPNTLLSHTYDRVVEWQREYGEHRGNPWGASESAYYFLNLEMHYQYRAFGVPGLGMKRGLAEEYVIAPYATMLALMVDPQTAMQNLMRLEKSGGLGMFGFYDAIDYTPSRLKEGESCKVVQSYMAHHHGMGLVAINNVLNGWKAHHYFHSDLKVRGCELLLQERIPRGVPVKEPHPIDVELEAGEQKVVQMVVDHQGMDSLDRQPPRLHLLSNGSYSLLTSHAGVGFSSFGETALTDWTPDLCTVSGGPFFYIRDLESGQYWSASHQPVRRKPDRYDTWFHHDRIVTSRVDEWIETTTEVCVSTEHPFELRRVTLTNYADRNRSMEITSYIDVALNRQEDHHAHPAFSRLFLQTEYLPRQHALLARRRPRAEDEPPLWMVHTMTGPDHENVSEPLQFETDKEAFIGRNRTLEYPSAMSGDRLEGRLGNVVNPVLSLRRVFTLVPGEKLQFTFGMGVASSREEAVQLADLFQSRHAADRAFELAMVYSRVDLDHIGADPQQAQRFQRLLSSLYFSNQEERADESVLRLNRKSQQGLWPYSISGDFPIVVQRVQQPDQLKSVATMLKAHSFWHHKGLRVDLVLINEHPPTYADELQEALLRQIEQHSDSQWIQKRGGIYLLRSDQLPEEDFTLLQSVAHMVVNGRSGRDKRKEPIAETSSWRPDKSLGPVSMDRSGQAADPDSDRSATDHSEGDETGDGRPDQSRMNDQETDELISFNGYGGFSPSGDEYRILIGADEEGELQFPPAPWINVLANPTFGTIVSEKGAGYTWSGNSRENKLTSWSNDPVLDTHSEAFWVRDESNGSCWSPMPGPTPGEGDYRVSHGFGTSRFEHHSAGIGQEVVQFVARHEPVKLVRISLENGGDRERSLSLFSFLEWVLGDDRTRTARHISTEMNRAGTIIYARNAYREEYQDRVAFASLSPLDRIVCERSSTSDRSRFIGVNRTISAPAALTETGPLDGRVVTGGDPCAAFRVHFTLAPGERATFLMLMGEGRNREDADRLVELFSSRDAVSSELRQVGRQWEKLLGRVRVELPDELLMTMMNGWLLYQTICCRLWARTGFYQSGGAFGFRDQLQDVMAAWYADPSLCREQILLHAAHQFPEGDVLHWWHPPLARGIRSRITDDRLWLPWVTLFYIEASDDLPVLDEEVSWLRARTLEEGEHEVYLQPSRTEERSSLYEHCCRAIEVSLAFGDHGFPLIGAGDWNDGMNRVGAGGRGESVWLGFFLVSVLDGFAPLAESRGDNERAARYRTIAGELRERLNEAGWDGSWYLRAFYDDGTPLGSAESSECRIDAISQAWAVLSGVAPPERAVKALYAAESHLVDERDGIIRLLTPPFDRGEKDPGYIQGYLPGVRENGGQYTHGALWLVMAMARAGWHDRALRYLQMVNPARLGSDRQGVLRYKVEPYVVAADVYGELPLTGRGGWTWYTGSAGWMYRTVLEEILGVRFTGDTLLLTPKSLPDWPRFRVELLLEDDRTIYEITVESGEAGRTAASSGSVDGEEAEYEGDTLRVPLIRDGERHDVRVMLAAGQENGKEEKSPS